MTAARRTTITALIALGLHLGLVLAVGTSGRQVLRTADPERVEQSVEIELSELTGAPPSATSSPTVEKQLVASVRTRAHAVPLPNESAPVESSAQGPEARPAPSEPTPSPAPGPRLSLAQIGVGVPAPSLGPRKAEKQPDPVARAARSVEKSINDELARRDRALGLGSDGPVVSAIERAAYGSTLDGNGKATLLARIDSSGRVDLLEVLNVDGDHKGWTRVARQALRTLSRKKLRVPQGSKGVELRISVESRWALPSGADPGLEVRLLGVPLKKGQGKRSSKIAILEPKAKVEMVDVPQPGGESIRMPSPQVGIGVLGVAGDVSDIGVKPRRIVHAKVESQKLL